MGYTSGTVEVGEDATSVCAVPEGGVMIRNLGEFPVFLGGPDVGNDGDAAGFPLDPGETQSLTGAKPKEATIVPAPPDDMQPLTLFARTAPGSSVSRVSWLAVETMGGVSGGAGPVRPGAEEAR